jgi:transcriptional regulator of arginine metabolism
VHERRRLIAQLLERHEVTSQQQLADLLAVAGQRVTQATVSRDLDRLGAVRVRRPGGMTYALPVEEDGSDREARLRAAMALVRSMEPAANLVILKTAPANAMPLASALDHAALDRVAGTVGGDDTVVIVAREPWTGRQVTEQLAAYTDLGRGDADA